MKNKISLFFLVLLVFSPLSLSAEEELFTLEGDEVIFDKDTRICNGSGVVLRYLDGSTLMCGKAEIDTAKMIGNFSQGLSDQFVVYEGTIDLGKDEPAPLKVTSLDMQVIYGEPDAPLRIFEVVAKNDVTIDFNNEILATCDVAQFKSLKPLTKKDKWLDSGLFTLLASDPEIPCSVRFLGGNMVYGNSIKLDPASKGVNCDTASGRYTAFGEYPVTFSSDHLQYNPDNGLLVLTGNVKLHYDNINITTETLTLTKDEEKSGAISLAKGTGKTVVIFKDPSVKRDEKLISYGPYEFDLKRRTLVFTTPDNEEGRPILDKQVSFQDNLGGIAGDLVEIAFEEKEGVLKPSSIDVKGHVRIRNLFMNSLGEDKPIDQIALADHINYKPGSLVMTLEANPKRRVLFHDKTNGFQLSAPSLTIQRGTSMLPEARGIGNVRLQLSDKEMHAIQKVYEMFTQ